jgi:hypothetical protein
VRALDAACRVHIFISPTHKQRRLVIGEGFYWFFHHPNPAVVLNHVPFRLTEQLDRAFPSLLSPSLFPIYLTPPAKILKYYLLQLQIL